jgi:hypothetical protein
MFGQLITVHGRKKYCREQTRPVLKFLGMTGGGHEETADTKPLFVF